VLLVNFDSVPAFVVMLLVQLQVTQITLSWVVNHFVDVIQVLDISFWLRKLTDIYCFTS
jgi:hypothetical protein